ncbi:MAG: hypothetical protein QXQ94_05900 [Candidatus Bathyarchaeia archaeon]
MKINYKKSLKLITLLITSLFIATVSAQIYSYMYIEGSGTITTGGLSWQLGNYAPAGASIVGYTVKNLNLSVPQNQFKNITDCLRIINNDATGHTFGLEVTYVGGDTGNFTTFNLAVYNATGTYGTLNLKVQGNSVTGLYIGGSATLYVRFEIEPATDKTGSMYFTVKLTYES